MTAAQLSAAAVIAAAGAGERLGAQLPKALVERWGFRLSKVDPVPPHRAPVLGEHNERVLGEILGLTATEIGRLAEDGVI